MSDHVMVPFGVNKTKRYVSKGGEDQLFKRYDIGDSGKVELVDYMGGDGTVERVATMGHGREIFPENPGEKEFINYLSKNGIYIPFNSVQMKFNIQSPISVALTLVYEKGVSVNEYSGRYSVMLDTSHVLDVNDLASRLNDSDPIDRAERAIKIDKVFRSGRNKIYHNYQELIEMDMARELARSGLGTDNDTKYFLKMDLLTASKMVKEGRAYFRSGNLTRNFIEVISEIAEKIAPISWNTLLGNPPSDLELTMPRDELIVDSGIKQSTFGIKKTKRVTVESLEGVLFSKENFLDHGEFQVVDYLGNDNSFAEAARVSYGAGTKTTGDNKLLIKSLIRDLHTSPIEMAELAIESKSPMFIDPRQAARHRNLDNHGFMGYHPIGSQFYIPEDSEFKYQDRLDRQGRGKGMDLEDLIKAKKIYLDNKTCALETVDKLRELNAPEDIVRMTKGVGFYSNMWRTGDPHNYAHFLGLRLDSHAQMEVRELAKCIRVAMEKHTPIAMEAFDTYLLNGIRLSEKEIIVIQKNEMLDSGIDLDDIGNYKGGGFLVRKEKGNMDSPLILGREGLAFQEKLKRLMSKE